MTIVITALQYLGYVLIFPGFLFCFLAGMLLCGIDRKLVAKMQKRVGPPILQPFYDFFKLCGKETIIPASASKTTFLMAPLVGLAALVVIQLFIPVFSFSAFSGMADVIVILYLLLIPAMSSSWAARPPALPMPAWASAVRWSPSSPASCPWCWCCWLWPRPWAAPWAPASASPSVTLPPIRP